MGKKRVLGSDFGVFQFAWRKIAKLMTKQEIEATGDLYDALKEIQSRMQEWKSG
jgi:hypothetical protein